MSRIEIPAAFIDKAKFVRSIFTDVQREYDTLLHVMTFSFDHVWRRRMFSRIDFPLETTILDLACGTGLVTFNLSQLGRSETLVVGLDLSVAMLEIAKRKKQRIQMKNPIEFVRAVGEFLPFRSSSFGYVTVGLALRNFGDKLAVFREALRVLLPLGWFLSVDFVRPENSLVWKFYKFHIFHVLPSLGRLVSRYWQRTLTYLANSIMFSASGEEICNHLVDVGFQRTLLERMTLGVVLLVGGQK